MRKTAIFKDDLFLMHDPPKNSRSIIYRGQSMSVVSRKARKQEQGTSPTSMQSGVMWGMTKQLLLWFTAVAQYEVRVDDWQRSCWQKDIKTLNVISLVFPFGDLWMALLRLRMNKGNCLRINAWLSRSFNWIVHHGAALSPMLLRVGGDTQKPNDDLTIPEIWIDEH